jgi:starch synthase (maltosyl-transferring)
MMRALAKAGFTQSYTYFTWRNTKAELTEYLTELMQYPTNEYFRPNFFTNTPDILPVFLQEGGRPAFRIRLVLAATLSPVYGIYKWRAAYATGWMGRAGRKMPALPAFPQSTL